MSIKVWSKSFTLKDSYYCISEMKAFLSSSFLFAFILYLATNITSAVAVAVNVGGQNIAISSSSESGDVYPLHVLRGLRASADDTTNNPPNSE